jgi:hypothetical protein
MAEEGVEKAEAGVDWFFVLTAPVTSLRDKTMILDVQGMSVVPAFASREEGVAFLGRLAPPEEYAVQAMHLQDIREFMESQGTAAVLLDGEGRLVRALAGDPVPDGEGGGGSGGDGRDG